MFGGDRVWILTAFDDTAGRVFASVSRLVDGDRRDGVALLESAYRFVAETVAASAELSAGDFILAAHTVFLTAEWQAGVRTVDPQGLSARERVALNLVHGDRLPIAAVARVLSVDVGEAQAIADAAVARVAIPGEPSSVADGVTAILVDREVWLDDSMRAAVRSAIARETDRVGRSISDTGPSATSTGRKARQRTAAKPRSPRGSIVAAGVVVAVVLASVTVWVTHPSQPADRTSLPSEPTMTATTDRIAPESSSSPSTTRTTSTEPPSGDVPTTADTAPQLPPGYLIDPVPAGYTLAYVGSDTGQDGAPPGWLDMWATPNATRTSGKWIALASRTNDTFGGSPLQRSRRADIGHRPAIVTTDPDGTQWTSVPAGDAMLDIASHGLSDDDIGVIVGDLTFRPDSQPDYGTDASHALNGFDLLVSHPINPSPLAFSLISAASTTVEYSTDNTEINVIVSNQSSADFAADLLLRAPPATPNATQPSADRHVSVGTHPAITGQTGILPNASNFVEWHDGTHTVSVSSSELDIDTLVSLAGGIRQATASEWVDAVRTIATRQPTGGRTSYGASAQLGPDAVVIGDQTMTSGSDVKVTLDPTGIGTLAITTSHPSNATTTTSPTSAFSTDGLIAPGPTADPNQPLQTYQFRDQTVLIYLATPGTAATLRVTIDGHPPVDTTIVNVGTLAAASYAFSDYGHFTAELLDPTGTTIQQLAT